MSAIDYSRCGVVEGSLSFFERYTVVADIGPIFLFIPIKMYILHNYFIYTIRL